MKWLVNRWKRRQNERKEVVDQRVGVCSILGVQKKKKKEKVG